ncbi:MAG: acyl-CoA dehydrogenase family protein [Shinella sp.]|uniref:acyl-CoA dehydrogenase family protein n=1 Tax=Shinella sp. TaxID=1870904 RepID=UPI004035EA42
MGTISSPLDRPIRTAAVISTEDEAIAVARTIAGVFGGSGHAPETAEARLDLLSRSGLLGVSVPTDHGGIDVSNTILATICTEAAAQSATLGEILAAHFVGLERVRSLGTEGQHNTVFSAALAGARLAGASVQRKEAPTDALTLVPHGLGWRLNGEAFCTPCTRHADWVLVPARPGGGKTAGLLLSVRVSGLRYAANTCEPANGNPQPAEHVLFKDVVVDGDTLLHPAGEGVQRSVPHDLELLLEASRYLGAGRRVLVRMLDRPDAAPFTVGLLSARLAAADAMIAEAGRAIDAAQIGLAEHHRTNAFLAAAAALAIAREASDHVKDAETARSGDAASTGGLPGHLLSALQESGQIHLELHRHRDDGEN